MYCLYIFLLDYLFIWLFGLPILIACPVGLTGKEPDWLFFLLDTKLLYHLAVYCRALRLVTLLPFVPLFCLNFVPYLMQWTMTFFCCFSLPLGFLAVFTLWPTSSVYLANYSLYLLIAVKHLLPVSIHSKFKVPQRSVIGLSSFLLSLCRCHFGLCVLHQPTYIHRLQSGLVTFKSPSGFCSILFDLCLAWIMMKSWNVLSQTHIWMTLETWKKKKRADYSNPAATVLTQVLSSLYTLFPKFITLVVIVAVVIFGVVVV